MSVETIARVLYDHVNSRFLKYVQDGTESLLGTAAKLRNAAGTIVNPATDEAISAVQTILTAIRDTAGIKKITDALPAGTNEMGKVRVTDGTKEVQVSAAGRLLVDARIASAGAGVVREYLLNGASAEMAINGGAGVQFEWNPGSSDVEGLSLSLIIEDASIYFGAKYGGISALTNGVLIETKAQDIPCTVANIKTTRELFQLSGPGGFDVYSATPDCARALIQLDGVLFAKAGTYAADDYVRVTIRDNLTGLVHQSVLFIGLEV